MLYSAFMVLVRAIITNRSAGLVLALLLMASLVSAVDARTAAQAAEFGRPDAHGIPVTLDGVPVHSTGTGFYVSADGHFVTAFHVAGNCARRAILRAQGPREATVVAMNPQTDLILLKSAPPRTSAAQLVAGAELAEGTAFEIIRYRHMGGLESRTSVIAYHIGPVRVADRPQISYAVRADERVVGGNSGSPLVLGGGGVAGLVDAVARDQPTLALIIDSSTIARMLTEAGVPFRWRDKATPVFISDEASLFSFPVACYVSSGR